MIQGGVGYIAGWGRSEWDGTGKGTGLGTGMGGMDGGLEQDGMGEWS